MFSPASLSPAAWFDAAYPKNVSNMNVVEVKNLGSLTTRAYSTTTVKPALAVSAKSGMNALEFNGSNYIMLSASISGVSGIDIYAVCKPTAIKTTSTVYQGDQIISGVNSGTTRDIALQFRNDRFTVFYEDGTGKELIITDTNPLNTWCICQGSASVATGAAARLNGGTAVTGACNVDNPIVNGIGGNDGSSSYRYRGFIGEIILFQTVLPDADRKKIEGYLAHKWGLTESLPSDHDYKTTPPAGSGYTLFSNNGSGVPPVTDADGNPCVRDILAVHRTNQIPPQKITTVSDGRFSCCLEDGAYDFIILDDDSGTQYADILVSRVS